MNLTQRIDLVTELGQYMKNNETGWQVVKEKANQKNSWFTVKSVYRQMKIVNHEIL